MFEFVNTKSRQHENYSERTKLLCVYYSCSFSFRQHIKDDIHKTFVYYMFGYEFLKDTLAYITKEYL